MQTSTWKLLGMALAFTILARSTATAQDQDRDPKKDTSQILPARSAYEAEVRAALEPIQERYAAKLKTLQADAKRKGDSQLAETIAAEIEKSKSEDVASALANRSPFQGTWLVKYANGTARSYRFRPDGTVLFTEEKRIGRMVRVRSDFLLDFGDNKLERLSLKPQMLVEHFNPANVYLAGGRPDQLGNGEKTK